MSPTRSDSQGLPPQAVDVFAGGGGLTQGLKKAGFAVAAAIENEPHAMATLTANHPEVESFEQDVRDVSGEALKAASDTGTIDLLAGCPPCQGFTSLTAKYRRTDPRNDLIHEITRLTDEARPRALMVENVPGLALRGRTLLDRFLGDLRDLGYKPTVQILQVADYGVPQFRRRLVVLAGQGFVIPMPSPTHDREGRNGLPNWKTVRQALAGLAGSPPMRLREARKKGDVAQSNWHLVRSLSKQNQLRLEHAQPGRSWSHIPESLRPPCHRGAYKGFTNVYGRMEWDTVSPTITGGCTTLSQGRFGHPEENRTISVREAALLQTFPADYRITTPYMDYACNIVGNALPCDFAEALARQCIEFLSN